MSYKRLFGPVLSRRMGISLGVDVVPAKKCPLDCIYCESGKTTELTTERKLFYPPEEIIAELKTYLSTNPTLDYITFSGAGEPTLYLGLGKILVFLKSEFPQYKTALITNSLLLSDVTLREELLSLNLIVPSIDAADEETFIKINRPVETINLADSLNGLILFCNKFTGKIWIEIFIIPGINDSIESISRIKEWTDKINGEKIQINSLDRPGTESNLKKADFDTLFKVKEFFGAKAEIVVRKETRASLQILDNNNLELLILNTISIRPMTVVDILSLTNLNTSELNKLLSILVDENKIKPTLVGDSIFYKTIN